MALFYLYSFGCKVNQAEGEQIAASLSRIGWERVFRPDLADLLIVNACAVTSEAERKARKFIRRLKQTNPSAFLLLTGCYAEVPDLERLNLPLDLIVSQGEKDQIAELLQSVFSRETVRQLAEKKETSSSGFLKGSENRSRMFIKIQDGCGHFCSYCIVPHFRGREESLPSDEVLKQVREASLNFKEVVLCGIRLGRYGRDLNPPASLVKLLKEIFKKTEIGRVRLSSLELNDLTFDLLELMAEEKRLAPHLHLPLQSGDNEILKRMNRPYTAEQFREKSEEIKKIIPDISLTTDVMLGFPGESEKAFLNTVKVVKSIGFSRLHLFKFSPRPGTLAYSFSPRVPARVVQERFRIMQEIGQELKSQYARKFLQRSLEVLPEKKVNGLWEGLSQNYLRVYFSSLDSPLLNQPQIIKVFIEEEKEGSLFGKILKEKEECENGLSVLSDNRRQNTS